MQHNTDRLIAELEEFINNSSDNELVGLASCLLCSLQPDNPEWNDVNVN